MNASYAFQRFDPNVYLLTGVIVLKYIINNHIIKFQKPSQMQPELVQHHVHKHALLVHQVQSVQQGHLEQKVIPEPLVKKDH